MTIIIGLGNPGQKFENTRHNVGFQVVNKIADNFRFSIFDFQSISNSEISKGEISGEKVILVKPHSFMNESGKTVKKITTYYKLPTKNLVVIHDDIDLPVGKIKIVKKRGSAGHKGVESIIKSTGNKNLIRIRIGIAPQTHRLVRGSKAGKIVLKNFSKKEQEIIEQTLPKVAGAIDYLIKNGLEKTMNEYN
ncbi:aminoacyl-tRNA hydrolase [Patescibacteria group bacterium]|nr:aminoacyl-tRNA hydrolase [Patescibacteria group bacterium]